MQYTKLRLIELFIFTVLILIITAVSIPFHMYDIIQLYYLAPTLLLFAFLLLLYDSLSIWWKYRNQHATGDQADTVSQVLQRIAEEQNAQQPKLIIKDSTTPNTYTVEPIITTPIVVVTTELIEVLNDQELEAVLAHEVAHINTHDSLLVIYLWSLIKFIEKPHLKLRQIIFQSNNTQQEQPPDTDDTNDPFEVLLMITISIPLYVITYTTLILFCSLFYAISKQREHLADKHASEQTSPQTIQSALTKIQEQIDYSTIQTETLETGGYFVPVEEHRTILFRTHPELPDRIQYVETL